jgi:transposase
MKSVALTNPEAALAAIHQEISHSDESRYHHRLHALLLVINGQSCQQVAALFGEDRRTVQRWIKRFKTSGLDGLRDGERQGRTALLDESQLNKLSRELHLNHAFYPGKRWDGRQLAEHLRVNYGVSLGVRQCQRLLCQMRGYRPATDTL